MNDSLAIGLEIFAAVIEAILIVAACSRKNITRKPELYILLLTCSTFLVLIFDAGIYILWGNMQMIILQKILWVLDYLFVATYSIFLNRYLVSYIEKKVHVPKSFTWVFDSICIVMVCLWIISMFNGMFFYYDTHAELIYTEYFFITQIGIAIPVLIDGVVIIRYSKKLGFRDTLIFLTYSAFTSSMIVFENEYEMIPLYLTMTLSTLIIYIMIILDQDRRVAEQKLELSENQMRIMLS